MRQFTSVPKRKYAPNWLGTNDRAVTTEILMTMREEMTAEVLQVWPHQREKAAYRNGLKAVQLALGRRGFAGKIGEPLREVHASEAGEALASTYQHGKSDLSLLPPAGSK